MMERRKRYSREMDNVTSDQSPLFKKEEKKWKKTQQAIPINACHWIYDLVANMREMDGWRLDQLAWKQPEEKRNIIPWLVVLSSQPSAWFLAIKPCVK